MILNNTSLDAAKFASTSTERPTLNTLALFSDRVAATDAYKVIEVMHPPQDIETPDGLINDSETCLIPSASCLHASKNVPKGEVALPSLKFAYTNVKGRDVTIASTDIMEEKTVETRTVEGNFPAYKAIFPKELPVKRVMLDAKMLKDIADYFAKHGEGSKVELQLFESNSRPVVFKAKARNTGQGIRAAQMPLRADFSDEETNTEIHEKTQTKIEDENTVTISVPGQEDVTMSHTDFKELPDKLKRISKVYSIA